jgi:hypothetical protein
VSFSRPLPLLTQNANTTNNTKAPQLLTSVHVLVFTSCSKLSFRNPLLLPLPLLLLNTTCNADTSAVVACCVCIDGAAK